jgi:hypothetical protein
MPFEYHGWTLYTRDVKLKRGPRVTIYFFSKKKPKVANAAERLPPGKRVVVNERTGLPFLKSARPDEELSEDTLNRIRKAKPEVLSVLEE